MFCVCVCIVVRLYICKRFFVFILYIFELHSIATGVFKLVPLEERSAEIDFPSTHLQGQVSAGV